MVTRAIGTGANLYFSSMTGIAGPLSRDGVRHTKRRLFFGTRGRREQLRMRKLLQRKAD